MRVMNDNSLSEQRTELAEERTDWAEDRTVLANERTYAGWMRTGMASMAIGLGFQAIFGEFEGAPLAKTVATFFILIGAVIIISAWRNAKKVAARMNSHAANPLPPSQMSLITGLYLLGAAGMTTVLWLL